MRKNVPAHENEQVWMTTTDIQKHWGLSRQATLARIKRGRFPDGAVTRAPGGAHLVTMEACLSELGEPKVPLRRRTRPDLPIRNVSIGRLEGNPTTCQVCGRVIDTDEVCLMVDYVTPGTTLWTPGGILCASCCGLREFVSEELGR